MKITHQKWDIDSHGYCSKFKHVLLYLELYFMHNVYVCIYITYIH